MNKKSDILKAVVVWAMLLFLLILATSIWFLNWHAVCKNKLEPTPYYSGEFPLELCDVEYYNITQGELRILIEKEITKHYIYRVDDSKQEEWTDATSNWFIRTVWMRSKYDNVYDYGRALAHELVRIKYITINDAWVEFQTFKILYESDYKILHDLGKYYGLKILNHRYAEHYETIGWQYDVSEHVINYLKEN